MNLDGASESSSVGVVESNYGAIYETFAEMKLKETLLSGINAIGFKKPYLIQQHAIVPCATGQDVIIHAPAGTGKTAALSMSILQRIDETLSHVQAVVMVPTPDVAQRTQKLMCALGEGMNIKVHDYVGRSSTIRKLEEGVHVVVATPGYVNDLINRGVLRNDGVTMFALDETDDMLYHGLNNSIYDAFSSISEIDHGPKFQIYDTFSSKVQVVLSSPTMPTEVVEVAQRLMKDPVHIRTKRDELTLQGVHQYYVNADKDDYKLEIFCDLYTVHKAAQVLIFCNSRERVEKLADEMTKQKQYVSCLHEGMEQAERDQILRDFVSGSSFRILIATDFLDRGIDTHKIPFVINYDLPAYSEQYIFRIGRCNGFEGYNRIAINFVTEQDKDRLIDIQTFYSTVIEEMPASVADLL